MVGARPRYAEAASAGENDGDGEKAQVQTQKWDGNGERRSPRDAIPKRGAAASERGDEQRLAMRDAARRGDGTELERRKKERKKKGRESRSAAVGGGGGYYRSSPIPAKSSVHM